MENNVIFTFIDGELFFHLILASVQEDSKGTETLDWNVQQANLNVRVYAFWMLSFDCQD